MIQKLTIEKIAEVLKSTPEQSVYDWKTDLVLPNTDEARGELLKDISAIANSLSSGSGFVLLGVDPRRPDPIVGMTKHYDDASLQQLVRDKIDPPIEFLYYEVADGDRYVGVIHVVATRKRPHIIRVDLGKVRRGMIVVRRGSATDGVTLADLMEFFYGDSSGYFPTVIQRLRLDLAQQLAATERMRELRERQNDLLKQMEITAGLPPGSLGARW